MGIGLFLPLGGREARAGELITTIDLQYTTTRDYDEGLVIYTKELRQKYTLEYITSLTPSFLLSSKLTTEYTVTKKTNELTLRKLQPPAGYLMAASIPARTRHVRVRLESSHVTMGRPYVSGM